jgi:hypothetical protein
MDHGRLFSRGEATQAQAVAFTGRDGLGTIPVVTLQGIGGAKQIAFSQVAGAPILSVTRPDGTIERLDAAGQILTAEHFEGQLARAVAAAWPGARLASFTEVSSDNLLRSHEGWLNSVRQARLAGGGFPDLYVDANTGRLATVMDASRQNYAWAYYALHTLRFPGLVERPVLRKSVVLLLLLAGFLFSLTGVIIGWLRLRRSLETPALSAGSSELRGERAPA